MHICFVSQEYPPETGWGGIGTYTFEMAHALAKLGHSVSVITRSVGAERIETNGNLIIHRINLQPDWNRIKGMWWFNHYWPGFAWAAFRRLREIHRTNVVDLVEAAETRADSFFLPIGAHSPRIIVRLHTAQIFADQISQVLPNRKQRVKYWLEKQSIHGADAITSPTHAMLELTRTWTTVDNKQIAVIPNPVNTETFSPASVQRSSEVLYVGRLEHRKIFVLAQAVPRILDRNENLNIRFLGKDSPDNSGMSWRERILASVPSAQRHRLVFEHVAREQLADFYRKAALVTLPSVWENFPYAILEAMACGTSAVCTRVGGYPELIQDGISGVLVPPANPDSLTDAICDLMDDPARREKLGMRARERVLDCFATERIVPRMLEFYERVLD